MRTERIDQDIKFYLDKIFREDLRNIEKDSLVTVTSVKTTKDLKYATVYVSIFGTKYTHKVFAKLEKSSGYIRKCLGQMLKARNVPDLVFRLDDSMEYGSYMDKLIDELKAKEEKQ